MCTCATHKRVKDSNGINILDLERALRMFKGHVTIGDVLNEAEIEYVPGKTYYNGILVSEKMLKGPVDGKFGAAQMIMVVE